MNAPPNRSRGTPIRLIVVEDCDDDAQLAIRMLRDGGFAPTWQRVARAAALADLLARERWDAVIADYRMPGFSGLQALDIVQRANLEIPFILVSGTIGEAAAVAAIKAGANDYVMKENLAQLPAALKRELRDAERRIELRAMQQDLIQSEERFNAFMNASPAIAWIKDESGRHLYMNRGWDQAFGVRHPQWAGKTEAELVSPAAAERILRCDLEVLRSGQAVETVEETNELDGRHYYWRSFKFAFTGKDKQRLMGAIAIDITDEMQSTQTIHDLAFLDPLTRLPNRRLFLDRLHHALVGQARSAKQCALLYVDLDHFKAINDSYGHDAGDLLLQQIAPRLVASVRESDTVARLGGDEFVVILEDLSPVAETAALQAESIATKILASCAEPCLIDGREHACSASIGVTLFKESHDSVDDLLKRADLAMYNAKNSGRNSLRFFDPAMQAAVASRAALEADLRQGLSGGQFVLYYQAQVDASGRLTGAEGLLRWLHPRRGIVHPAEFIPLAEETDLILPLGRWVMEAACAQLTAWATRPETRHYTLAVNVSARQFDHPDFVAQTLELLARSGIDPGKLKLELTEGLLLHDVEGTIEKMHALKAVGVSFSLDDFGTGYSSLHYLKRLPLYQLKIDQSFVRDIVTDSNDVAIVRTIVMLGESLGLAVIAEGVETEEQRGCLASHGCHTYQGYLFGQPGSADQLRTVAPVGDQVH